MQTGSPTRHSRVIHGWRSRGTARLRPAYRYNGSTTLPGVRISHRPHDQATTSSVADRRRSAGEASDQPESRQPSGYRLPAERSRWPASRSDPCASPWEAGPHPRLAGHRGNRLPPRPHRYGVNRRCRGMVASNLITGAVVNPAIGAGFAAIARSTSSRPPVDDQVAGQRPIRGYVPCRGRPGSVDPRTENRRPSNVRG